MRAVRSQRYVVIDDDCEPEDSLLFRLTYEGPLHGSFNGNPRADEKHAIRKMLHPQLRCLWKTTALKDMVQGPFELFAVNGKTGNVNRLEYLSKNFSLLNGHFVPLITKDLNVWCGIDVLFLRTGRPGKLFERGDIDNRMKTLFDALKMPTSVEELGGHKFPADCEEEPFFCLLEDDGLVSKFSVEADNLLQPLTAGRPNHSDARLVLTVEIRPNSTGFGFA